MEFRVRDTFKSCWITNNIYLNSNGELFKIKKSLFGMARRPIALDTIRYVCHKAINLWDKNQQQVFEGDYIKARVADDREEIGLVAFAEELAAYVILCAKSDTFYTLGKDIAEYIEVIGNVFDGYERHKDGQQTL